MRKAKCSENIHNDPHTTCESLTNVLNQHSLQWTCQHWTDTVGVLYDSYDDKTQQEIMSN